MLNKRGGECNGNDYADSSFKLRLPHQDTNEAHGTWAATTLKSQIIYIEYQKEFETFRKLETFACA